MAIHTIRFQRGAGGERDMTIHCYHRDGKGLHDQPKEILTTPVPEGFPTLAFPALSDIGLAYNADPASGVSDLVFKVFDGSSEALVAAFRFEDEASLKFEGTRGPAAQKILVEPFPGYYAVMSPPDVDL